MDKIDKEIVTELMKNAKQPFLTIANKMGISPVTVQKRFEKLRKDGAIIGTSMIIDLSKIGFEGKAFLLATASKEYDPEITVDYISKLPNVFFIIETIGTFDILAMVAFRDITEILETVNKIRDLPTIDKVEVTLTSDTHFPFKEDFTKIQLFE